MSKYNKLQGSRVLIIGGSSGIGYAVAEAALESGAIVYISSSNQTKVHDALVQLDKYAGSIGREPAAYGRACDLSDTAATEANLVALLDFVTENKAKKLNHVVFTAGDAHVGGSVRRVTAEAIVSSFGVRIVGPLLLAKHLPEYTVRSNKTSFTLTSGSLATRPIPGLELVSGLAAATEGYARGLAVDIKPIRVNTVQAGAVRTPLLDEYKDQLDEFAKNTVTGTVGRVEEIAEAYLYLMKDSFITGAVIESSGGHNVGQSREVSEFN